MYSDTVTVFDFYETESGAVWYPHVLPGVELNTDKGQILRKYGADSADKATLHIGYLQKGGEKLIRDSDGKLLAWVPPKQLKGKADPAKCITFGQDGFFMKGIWEDGAVVDEEYKNGFYSYMNNRYDFVFKITSVGGPYTLIPHFEILGK